MENLSVGDIAKRCGVNVSALHFYERKGLISSTRNTGNQRRYGRDTIRRVSLIRVAQQLGISLEEVKSVFQSLPKFGAPNHAQWEKLAKHWQKQLNERITMLEKLRDSLTGCIGCGCLSMQRCPLYNPEDQAAKKGSGPVFLLQDE
ncbi:redox-sensitive transcriptional activator SoxR [Alteromonas sp. ASW11-130]|uniref:redox-sensitive transcriptional activator SoxR n=1 Tax=Alteromonas sp. ASW11-130 TaxID=3015775 RepID=UPI002241FEC6|nr:redox-sensitive transcriptional activator SoxR [Alteromonas sp. ASW11-130]MCW8092518.1 redox-sensitive transcriptional activator SoxR [Alteromonas sp. ASW11-130]